MYDPFLLCNLSSLAIQLTFMLTFNSLSLLAAESEAELRAKLGIPGNAKRVLILSQSSHMDWDWNETFLGYYQSKVGNILTQATNVLSKYRAESQPYYYSVAETGFLQHFWQQNPTLLHSLRQSGHTLHMVGGGITSPDSLLNHGEAFIRNFLIGQGALRNVSLPNITNIWIPDDLYVPRPASYCIQPKFPL